MSELVKRRPLLTAALAGAGSILLLKRLRRVLARRGSGQDPPFAAGWVPFLGHLLTVIKYAKDNNKVASGRWALAVKKSEGLDVFQMEVMGKSIVVIADADLAEEVVIGDPHRFTKDFSAFGGMVDLVFELFGHSGLFFAATDDPRWGIAHNILKAPFSTKGMKALFPMMSEQAGKLVETLKHEVGYGGVCHIDHWVTKMAFETIAVCGLGTSFGSFEDAHDHPFITAMNNMIAGMMPFAFVPRPFWRLLLGSRLKQIRADGSLVRNTCTEVIKKRREHTMETMASGRDLLDMMLNDKDPKSGKGMTEEMIVDNVLTFLFAGQDSTAAAMASCMCYLSANPECKAKLFKEIDDVVGMGELEWDHLSKLKYLDWCIKETLRLVPPAVGVARGAKGDQLLGGKWRIQDKSQVLISIMALHYDEKIWGPDAKDFRPERWETGAPHKYAFMPFASGPRSCTGREFTLIEQKITFVKLLQHFDFRRPEHVEAEEGYTTVKSADVKYPPFIGMDVEYKKVTAFVGLFSAFELLKRER